jgi:predicted RNase H-like HicB family nuclease
MHHYGEDVDDAITMAKEAIELYIEELKDHVNLFRNGSQLLKY